jgi:hypothetical protein
MPFYNFVGVRYRADEVAAGFQFFRRIPHHAVGLLETLETVMESKLTADQVKFDLRVSVLVPQRFLGAVRCDEFS